MTPAPQPGAAGGAAAAPQTAWPAGLARRPVVTIPVVVTTVPTVEVVTILVGGRSLEDISVQMEVPGDQMGRNCSVAGLSL